MRHHYETLHEPATLSGLPHSYPAEATSRADRRQVPRLQVHERIRINVDGAGWFTGSVIDCSDSGLGIYSARRLEPGDHILVSWKAGYFAGSVRNCIPSGDIWRVGVELEHLNAHRVLMLDLKGSRVD